MTVHTGTRRVVCLGDSITRAQVSVDYIRMLKNRTAGRPYAFTNAGVNGDLAYNVLQRLDPVIEQQPDVVVLIGTNDANASLSEKNALMMRKTKKLPVTPTIGWYRQNLAAITERLTRETGARVALLSLPVLGQQLASEPARRSGAYSEVVKETAAMYGAAYLPLHERQVGHLLASDDVASRIALRDGTALIKRTAARHFLLGQSFDGIARRRGLALTTDFIHQNSRGATMIADLVEDFLGTLG
ncbi:SGNH/GDSL hydrolase family protein [Streptomyces hokutonensis]|uniref:SGNH/GDSL hydrolase family protein n=1 Tax=Streptomyces hokutonensis TaxID=1306990 RepID=UPI00380DE8E6